MWKDIIAIKNDVVYDYTGLYRINEYGDIESNHSGEWKLIKPYLNGNYYEVQLSKNGVRISFQLSRLVASAFIPNPDNKPQVDHEDTNTLNNYYKNLRWVTAKENVNNDITIVRIKDHMKNNNPMSDDTIKKKSSKKSSKSRTKMVICKNNGMIFDSAKEAGIYAGVNSSNITRCCNGEYKFSGKDSRGNKLSWSYL